MHGAVMQKDPIAVAQSLLATGRQADAITVVANAAAGGYVPAIFQQALWSLAGTPLPRNLAYARLLLREAAERGHREARLIEIALVANGSGAAPDWSKALYLLERSALEGDGNASQVLLLLNSMLLDPGGAPIAPPLAENLTPQGTIRRVSGFLTLAECAHIARSATDLLAPAVVVDPRTKRSVPHPIRTSDAAVIGPVREDPVILAINRRIASVSDTDVRQGEALTVLRYSPGQQYRMHLDTLPQVTNQRLKTVLIYLNENFEGGETIFPDHNIVIRPICGDAVIFTNIHADGGVLSTARHAGLPVKRGVKWLATRWIRVKPFDTWKGPESSE